jgi:glutamate synthase domain-containing protein 2
VAVRPRATEAELYVGFIRELGEHGLTDVGPDGPMTAMGVPRTELPMWGDIQIMTAQLSPRPLQEGEHVGTDLVIGPRAERPLRLEIPLFVTDMSYGALSEEAKVALSRGAEMAGTGICSGEGGMLPEEQAANSRSLYEYASAGFRYSEEKIARVHAMHLSAGRARRPVPGAICRGAR